MGGTKATERGSLRRKLLLNSLALNAIALVAACIVFVLYERGAFRSFMVQDLVALTDLVGMNCRASFIFQDPADAGEILSTLKTRPGILCAHLCTSGGETLAQYTQDGVPRELSQECPTLESVVFGIDTVTVVRRVYWDEVDLGWSVLTSDLRTYESFVRKGLLVALGILVSSIVLVGFLSMRLERRITGPVRALAAVAGRVTAEGTYGERAPPGGEGEVAVLVEAFNAMLDTIALRDKALLKAKDQAEQAAREAARFAEEKGLANMALEREIERRRGVERELEQHRDALEGTVERRTDELRTSNQMLYEEIRERERAEASLRRSEENYRLLAETAGESILTLDLDMEITYVNRAWREMIGFEDADCLGQPLRAFLPEDQAKKVRAFLEALQETEAPGAFLRTGFLKKDGSQAPVEIGASALPDRRTPTGFLLTARDITERLQFEERIQASLREKETMLSEIHHRVNNNLQLISSLLDLTRRRTTNEEALSILLEARGRVYAMGLVHKQLYRSAHLDRIDMGEHVRQLFATLSLVYGKARELSLKMEAREVFITVTQAVPMALVLNELMSNVYKHTLKEGEKRTLWISLGWAPDGHVEAMVADDGPGIPADIDVFKTETLGLKLVRNLVLRQLHGDFHVETSPSGTRVAFSFMPMEKLGIREPRVWDPSPAGPDGSSGPFPAAGGAGASPGGPGRGGLTPSS